MEKLTRKNKTKGGIALKTRKIISYSTIGKMEIGNLQLKIKNETETKTFNLEDVPWVILRHHIRLQIEKSNPYQLLFWKQLYQKYQKRS